ncbi:Positive regulator of phenol hydroxylase [Nitrincola lacisaponensis]|uniref:Positive regulator of phenol hydroxylase n=1 Tax=Nitrincola lacisaponensis TaxID=267850 RepID=A0A063Y4X3_9GAMM|nr:sigma-54-dependent Fis family transcriptional regulator [Nitrincola lacisaponensis]KDE40724.1 Positive regulator of phenol hydroxylase [Nitrincola lacisaponensis]
MSDTRLAFPDLKHLVDKLHFNPEEGKIWLAEQRTVLMGLGALSSFRKEIITTLGMERGKGFFMRLGYYSGMRDAELAKKLNPHATPDEAFLTGPQLHCLRGMVKVVPLVLEYDPKKKHFYAEFEWIDSFEVEICRMSLGQLNEPACWMLLGYACAYSSHFTGLDIQFREVECRGQGDQHCYIVGKVATEWPDHEEFSHFFREAPLIDELYELQSRIADLEQSLGFPEDLPKAIGEAPPFTSALEMIDRGANAEVTMLLIGETGTGKEVLARRVHSMSTRKEGPFVAINCAAIPPELIESELFGVEKGAFTGATQSRKGRFERANGGTIFLDEVVELSPRAQAALLRVIQEGELERVGDDQTRKVDVRIVAATNEDLAEAVKAGRFRADLFYRINAYMVVIPPLRERQNDIALLAEHFRKRYEKLYRKATLGFTDRALAALHEHDWPGNIRELENTIERGIILTDEQGFINEQSLFNTRWKQEKPESAQVRKINTRSGQLENRSVESLVLDSLSEQVLSQEISIEAVEKALIDKAMQKSDGNISAAARLLGLTRAALAYRLKRSEEP